MASRYLSQDAMLGSRRPRRTSHESQTDERVNLATRNRKRRRIAGKTHYGTLTMSSNCSRLLSIYLLTVPSWRSYKNDMIELLNSDIALAQRSTYLMFQET